VEQSSTTVSRRSSRWSPSPPTHATSSDESWCQISRREVIKLAIHDTLQLPPTTHRLSDVLGFAERKMWRWDTQLFQSVTHGYVLVTAPFSFDKSLTAVDSVARSLVN
jgi:hypothetical protein